MLGRLVADYFGLTGLRRYAVITRFETPIANELGEFARMSYRDSSGFFRMDNSTDWGIINTRPLWHYVNPRIWGQPRRTLDNQNPWIFR